MNINPNHGNHRKEKKMNIITKTTPVAVLVTLGLALAARAAELPPAARVLKETGVSAGLAVVVGTTDGVLEADLTNDGKMLVQGLALSDDAAAKARQHLFAQKLYGLVSVSVVKTTTTLPYFDRLVNLLVADLDALGKDAPAKAEIDRVLGYEGVAYLKQGGKWTKTINPTPKEVDSWTHAHYDASGNAVSKDLVIGPPNTFRWADGPFGRNLIGGMRTSDGVAVQVNPAYAVRLLSGRASIPAELAGMHVWARDVNSGVPLWRRKIHNASGEGPYSVNFTETFVAAGGWVYIYDFTDEDRVALTALDIRSGAVARVFDQGVVCRKVDFRPEGVKKADWRAWANKTFSYGAVLVHETTLVQVVKSRITTMNAGTGDVRWIKPAPDNKVFLKAVIADGKLLVLSSSPWQGRGISRPMRLDAWRLSDGTAQWHADLGEFDLNDNTSDVFRMLVADRGHVLVSPVGAALDASTGRRLWEGQKTATYGAQIIGDRIWCGGSGSGPFWGVYQLADGKRDPVRRNGGTNQSACDWPTATPNWFMAKRNFIPIHAAPDGYQWLAMRPMGKQCQERGAASYGSVFTISVYCYCDHFIRGTAAFYAVPPVVAVGDAGRLEKVGGRAIGPVEPQTDARKSLAAFSWGKPEGVRSCWGVSNFRGSKKEYPCLQGYERTETPPVEAGGMMLRTYPHEHRLAALGDGREVWNFVAGGRIGYAPVVFRSLAIFASHDGYVYAVNVADGTLAWRFLAAPADRRHMFFGQVESAWPVFNVVLDGETVYCSAGRHEELDGGIHFYGLNAATGVMKWHVVRRRGYESNRAPIRARKTGSGMVYINENQSKVPYDDRAFLNDAIELREGKLYLFDKPMVDVAAPKDEIVYPESLVPPQFGSTR